MALKSLDDTLDFLPDELPQFVREYHEYDDPEYLFVPYYWEGIKNGKNLNIYLSCKDNK